jgi:hypothetical protein
MNVGTGWYHFDTNPIRSSINTFMFTSADAADYTRRITHIENFYVYDRSLYPPIVGQEELDRAGEDPPTTAEGPGAAGAGTDGTGEAAPPGAP